MQLAAGVTCQTSERVAEFAALAPGAWSRDYARGMLKGSGRQHGAASDAEDVTRKLPRRGLARSARKSARYWVAHRARTYQYLREVIVNHVPKVGFDYTREFQFGLDLLLEALKRARHAT